MTQYRRLILARFTPSHPPREIDYGEPSGATAFPAGQSSSEWLIKTLHGYFTERQILYDFITLDQFVCSKRLFIVGDWKLEKGEFTMLSRNDQCSPRPWVPHGVHSSYVDKPCEIKCFECLLDRCNVFSYFENNIESP